MLLLESAIHPIMTIFQEVLFILQQLSLGSVTHLTIAVIRLFTQQQPLLESAIHLTMAVIRKCCSSNDGHHQEVLFT
jgi:hypothetical protein